MLMCVISPSQYCTVRGHRVVLYSLRLLPGILFYHSSGSVFAMLVNFHQRYASTNAVICFVTLHKRFLLCEYFRHSPRMNEKCSSGARVEPRTYALKSRGGHSWITGEMGGGAGGY